MSSNQLDQLVKGAPSPSTTLSSVAAAAASPSAPSHALAAEIHESKKPSLNQPAVSDDDPTSLLPSSPPQIYLNLLILEASLRSQYLTLRARRRQHTFFLALLAIWNVYFFYALFLRPREDGKGVGGSPYWVVDMGEKVAFMGGLMTVLLIWGTGQLERGVRWPRRWVGITNRGLRGMNLKIVVLRGPWWKRILDQLSLLFPYGSIFGRAQGSEFRVVDFPVEKKHSSSSGNGAEPLPRQTTYRQGEEDVAPGGDAIKLLLLAKHFSPEFRENWELYRSEYWERENERRAGLRKLVRAREREIAKAQGGWLWWTGWRGWRRSTAERLTSSSTPQPHHHHIHHSTSRAHKDPVARKRGATADAHSRSSSRSSSVAAAAADGLGSDDNPHPRSQQQQQHRRVKSNLATTSISKPSRASARSGTPLSSTSSDSATTTAAAEREQEKELEMERTLHKRGSTLSNASSGSSGNGNDSEVSERSTTSTAASASANRPRQRDLALALSEAEEG